jgi:hypothetical protein
VQFRELLQRDFQLALADEAPGSNHVGNDVDTEALCHVNFPDDSGLSRGLISMIPEARRHLMRGCHNADRA